MAKLSQQLLTQQAPIRINRTQRQVGKFQAIDDFNRLKAEANQIQQTEFSNIQSINDYEQRYNKLSPQIKQFFQTPQELREQQRQRIEENKIKVQKDLEDSQRELRQLESEESTKDNKLERRYLIYYIKGLGGGLGRLNSGEDISYSDIEGYASSMGNNERNQRQASYEQRDKNTQAYNKLLETPLAESYKKAQLENPRIDWTNKANVKAIADSVWIEKNSQVIAENIAKGNLTNLQVEYYKGVVGNKEFTKTQDAIKIEVKKAEDKAIAESEERKFIRNINTNPVVDRTGWSYISGIGGKYGAYGKVSGTGSGGTMEIAPLTTNEIIKIDEANRYGTTEKIVMFVNDNVKKVLSTTSDIYKNYKKQLLSVPVPLFTISGGYGKDISLGDIEKEVSKSIGDTLSAGKKYLIEDTLPIGDVPIWVIGGGGTLKLFDAKKKTKLWYEKNLEQTKETQNKQLENLGIIKELEPKYQEINQNAFDDEYEVKLIKGEITFEEAQKEFEQSEKAKSIQNQYQNEINKKLAGKITPESFKLVGLSLKSLGIDLIPETYGELAYEGTMVGAYVYGSSLLPKKVLTVINKWYPSALGIYGASQYFDPRLSGEQRLIGGAMVVGSTLILGNRLIKDLKTVTLKEVKIDAPLSVKAESTAGRSGKIIRFTYNGKTGILEEVYFPKQKLYEVGIAGRRTVMSTKWRDVVTSVMKKFNVNLDLEIYKGVPTSQLGKTYYMHTIRGDYIYNFESAYQKALRLMAKSNRALYTNLAGKTSTVSLQGLSQGRLKNILRYYAPRRYDITLEKGMIKILNKEAFGKFKVLTKQPSILIDEELGIKTRGGRTVRNYYDMERYIENTINDESGIITNIRKRTVFVTDAGGEYNTLRQAGKTTTSYTERSLVKAGEVQDMFLRNVLKQKLPYKMQNIVSRYALEQTIPFKRGVIIGKQKTSIISSINDRDIIEYDFDKARGISYRSENWIEPNPNIKKTPWSKTFGEGNVEEVKRVIQDINKNKPLKIEVINEPLKIEVTELGKENPLQVIQESRYAGTGQYERTESFGGGMGELGRLSSSDLSQLQMNQLLKSAINPQLDTSFKIKDIILSNQKIVASSLLREGLMTGTSLKMLLANKQGLELKPNLMLKDLIKTETKLDLGLKMSIKQTQAVNQAQAQISKLTNTGLFSSIPIRPPSLKTRIEFKPPTFKIPPFYFELPEGKQQKKKQKSDKELVQELLYIPDFTSRALGLEADVLSEKQADRQLKKILTGLEIRRGIIIKPNTLLKGIPN
jgi:hypothetical protein